MVVETKDHRDTIDVNVRLCRKIYTIMKAHVGKDNAIPAKTISAKLNFPMEDTQVKCRTYISKVIDMYEVPIIGCSKGYFIAETPEEVSEYMASMNRRIRGIRSTAKKIDKYFQNGQNP